MRYEVTVRIESVVDVPFPNCLRLTLAVPGLVSISMATQPLHLTFNHTSFFPLPPFPFAVSLPPTRRLPCLFRKACNNPLPYLHRSPFPSCIAHRDPPFPSFSARAEPFSPTTAVDHPTALRLFPGKLADTGSKGEKAVCRWFTPQSTHAFAALNLLDSLRGATVRGRTQTSDLNRTRSVWCPGPRQCSPQCPATQGAGD